MVGHNKEKIVTCSVYLPKSLHDEFISKIVVEGWTAPQALYNLILFYVKDRIFLKE